MDREQFARGPLVNVVPLTGGTQNLLLRFERAGARFVLRRPPLHPTANGNDTMRKEARVLQALATTDVPHPRLIAACADESVLGAAFYLMEPVDGFNATLGLPALHAGDATARRRMGFALMEALAKLATVDYRAVGLGDLGKVEGFLERQVGRWLKQFDGYAEYQAWRPSADFDDLHQIAAWLEGNRPRSFSPGILHGDFHIANVMYRNDSAELAAIVDWELATIGDPLIDLGWILASLPSAYAAAGDEPIFAAWDGFPGADELVRCFADSSCRDVSSVDWYHVFACYKLAILLEGTYARASVGKAMRETGDQLHNKAAALLRRAARLTGLAAAT